MPELFISYSTHNADFARYVRGLLQNAGFDVWMDETKLSAGQSWTDTLEANITSCSAFVIIMSPDSKTSDWVRRERLLAERLRKPIFPILYAGDSWWDLANIQYEDMRAGLNATLSPRMIDGLRRAVRGETAVAQAEPTGTHLPVPAPTSTQTDSRKLEAAMPAETKAGSDTEVWAKISLPTSEGLRGELPAMVPSGDVIQKGDTRTSGFPIRFPVDPRTGQRLPAQAELRVAAGDFVIAAPGERIDIEIPPDADSRTVIFTLEANPHGKTSGRSRLFIDLIHEQKVIAQVSVSTVLVERVTAAVPTWTLAAVGYVAPQIGAVAPGAAASSEVLRDAPSIQAPATSTPQATIEEKPQDRLEWQDQQERGASGAAVSSADDVDADEALPTYNEVDDLLKKTMPTDDGLPVAQPAKSQPEYSGSASRSAPMDSLSDFEPMPARVPRRASNTPLRLASLFAALGLVFVVLLTISRQGAGPANVATSLSSGTQFALLATDTTTTGAVDQVATSVALTLNAQGVAASDIAVAPMVNCTGSPGAELVGLLKSAGLDANLLDSGITTEADARRITEPYVVAWGVCYGDTLTLTLELNRSSVVGDNSATVESISVQTPPAALSQRDSHAARLVAAVTEYAVGSRDYTALAQTFEDLAASATSAEERAALRTLQQNSVYFGRQNYAPTATAG